MDTQSTPTTVTLSNGQTVLDLYNMESTSPAALVNLNVIKRLASLLPSVSTRVIVEGIKEKLDTLMGGMEPTGTTRLASIVSMMEDEVAFHKTVNLITTVEMPVNAPGMPQLAKQH